MDGQRQQPGATPYSPHPNSPLGAPNPGSPYGAPTSALGPSPYGQPPSPYGQPPSPYGQAPNPYGQAPNPYGQAPNPYAAPVSDASPHWGMGMGMGMGEGHILASRGNRFAGSVVDGLLYVVALIPGIALAAGTNDDALIGLSVIVPMLMLACAQWYLVATTGQSLAKRWLGMKIIKTSGEDVGFVSGVLLRSWVVGFINLIPVVGSIFPLLDALFIFGDEHRTLHDMIAGTKVISV